MSIAVSPTAKGTRFSFVLETPAADPAAVQRHVTARLSLETDPADVWLDMQRGKRGFVILDVRSAEAYEQCHVPGALSMPWRTINETTTAELSKDDLLVVYCWGPGCNSATKAAGRLAGLGFRVKEMIGGIEYWRREGNPVEGTLGDKAPLVG